MAQTVTSITFISKNGIAGTGSVLANALGVSFIERESSFRGGAYLLAGGSEREQIIVQRNSDDDLDDPIVPGAPASATLVYVERTTRPDEVIAAVEATDLRLIERKDWEPRS